MSRTLREPSEWPRPDALRRTPCHMSREPTAVERSGHRSGNRRAFDQFRDRVLDLLIDVATGSLRVSSRHIQREFVRMERIVARDWREDPPQRLNIPGVRRDACAPFGALAFYQDVLPGVIWHGVRVYLTRGDVARGVAVSRSPRMSRGRTTAGGSSLCGRAPGG